MLPLRTRPDHAEANRAKDPKQPNRCEIQHAIQPPLGRLRQASGGPVDTEAGGEDSEVEGRVVVVNVSDATHGDEGQVVQEPAEDGVEAGVVDLVEVGGGQVGKAALRADGVECDEGAEEAEGERGAPVDKGIAEEEVFDD